MSIEHTGSAHPPYEFLTPASNVETAITSADILIQEASGQKIVKIKAPLPESGTVEYNLGNWSSEREIRPLYELSGKEITVLASLERAALTKFKNWRDDFDTRNRFLLTKETLSGQKTQDQTKWRHTLELANFMPGIGIIYLQFENPKGYPWHEWHLQSYRFAPNSQEVATKIQDTEFANQFFTSSPKDIDETLKLVESLMAEYRDLLKNVRGGREKIYTYQETMWDEKN